MSIPERLSLIGDTGSPYIRKMVALLRYRPIPYNIILGDPVVILEAMEAHLAEQHFMLGVRPRAGNFALYGQLTQLIGFDPTSRAIAHALAAADRCRVDTLLSGTGCEAVVYKP